jgi:hypothetical protein
MTRLMLFVLSSFPGGLGGAVGSMLGNSMGKTGAARGSGQR